MNGSPKPSLIACVAASLILIVGCGDAKRTEQLPGSEFRFDAVTNVTELVESLVSPVPPKHASTETDVSVEETMNGGFTHPQVAAARARLIAMGTRIYPELAKHVKDDRYSYSIIASAWLNQSVGDALVDTMGEGIEFSGYGYKWRTNKSIGNPEPTFAAMVSELGWEKYADYASTRSKADLQKEFVRWKLNKEREFGFTNIEQEKKITEPYLKWLAEH